MGGQVGPDVEWRLQRLPAGAIYRIGTSAEPIPFWGVIYYRPLTALKRVSIPANHLENWGSQPRTFSMPPYRHHHPPKLATRRMGLLSQSTGTLRRTLSSL